MVESGLDLPLERHFWRAACRIDAGCRINPAFLGLRCSFPPAAEIFEGQFILQFTSLELFPSFLFRRLCQMKCGG
jgi:hypothetical protein